MQRLMALSALVLGTVLGSARASVLHLMEESFDAVIDGSVPSLIDFYAPWCGHCKRLAPDFELVGDAFQDNPSDVLIGKVDATSERDLATRFDITGFPTIKWFPKGAVVTPEDYTGERSAQAMVDFVNQRTGLGKRVKQQSTAVLTIGSQDAFSAVTDDASKDVLVKFYAPWCGHCKSLAPVYEEVAGAFRNEPNVVVAKVDATKHRVLAEAEGVTGYPTIKFYAAGSEPVAAEYDLGFTAHDFVEFLNQQAGTKRMVGGGLKAGHGRDTALDELARAVMAAVRVRDASSGNNAEATAAVEAIKAHCEGDKKGACPPTAKHYMKIASRLLERGPSYASAEKERLMKMIAAGSISLDKRDMFTLRLHILDAFATPTN